MREAGHRVPEKKEMVERMACYLHAKSNALAKQTNKQTETQLPLYLTQFNFCYVSISPKENKSNLICDSFLLSIVLSKLHRLG